MKPYLAFLVLLPLVFVAQTGIAADIERTETIEKSFRVRSVDGDRQVIVDNVFGSIEVTGYSGEEVQVKIHKTTRARSEKKAVRAAEEVQLRITEDDGSLELYVDGPFRERDRHGVNWRGYKRESYEVIYDFELKIPRDCSIELSTVNDGDIRVESVEGDFDVHNVNGGVEMKYMSGSGDVYTVNGKLTTEFRANPSADCSFRTINGDVRLYFQPGLSADFYLKTMNGDAFTDFEVSSLPAKSISHDATDGGKVYKVGHLSGVRAGNGGPEIQLNTLNGDMFILSL